MKLFKYISLCILGVGVFSVLPSKVTAACTTQYGGSVTCPEPKLKINKEVAKPRQPKVTEDKGGVKKVIYEGALSFSDNLGIENAHRAGQEVVFKLIVTNNDSKTYTNIKVVDKLPDFIRLDSHPGKLVGKTLEYTIEKLEPGKSDEQTISGFVFELKDIIGPNDFCLSNRGEVSAEDQAHNDSAQLCVIKEEPAKKLPVAGFNDIFMMIPFIGAGLGGFALMRKNG